MKNILNDLTRITPDLKHKTGAKYILFLIKHPNRYYAYFLLEMIINDEIPENIPADIYFDYIDKYKFLNTPVKMTDNKTLADIKDRLNTLNYKIAHAESMNISHLIPEIYSEKEQLISYLKECLKQSGGIKHFAEQNKISQNAVKKAIKRFVSEVRVRCPELYYEITDGLRMDNFGIEYQ